MTFFERVFKLCQEKKSALCVGLDPHQSKGESLADLARENKRIIEETAPYAVCYKPNSAFYECLGPPGMELLEETIQSVPPEIPVLLDAKRGDIASTAEAYARSCFEYFQLDAVTLSPYLGEDSLRPFLAYESKGVFVLARTSNPSAGNIQELEVNLGQGGGATEPLYRRVASRMTSISERVGLVVSAKEGEILRELREAFPKTWFLVPGVGAQGGSLSEALAAGARSDGCGMLINVSRGIACSSDPGEAAHSYQRETQKFLETRGSQKKSWNPSDWRKAAIVKGLIEIGAFRTGSFTLKSGKVSPFYIDLRLISSAPWLLRLVAGAYAELAGALSYDRIAGIPVAALPLATALSLEVDKPMIYPRMPRKLHGTARAIEGEYRRGEQILLLDDLITTGGSKEEVISILKEEGGLQVDHLVVLISRGRQRGGQEMAKLGVSLHAYLEVEELLQECHRQGVIDQRALSEMIAYTREEE